MRKSLSVQIFKGPDCAPAFVVIPYADYVAQRPCAHDLIPHEVVTRACSTEVRRRVRGANISG